MRSETNHEDIDGRGCHSEHSHPIGAGRRSSSHNFIHASDANKGPGIIVVASYRGTIVASFFNAPGATVRNRSALSTI